MKDQGRRVVDLMNHLAEREPFFAHLILSQKLVEDKTGKDVPTMGVDGLRLYYNPDFTNTPTDDELVGVLAHEALHLAYQHPLRRGERDPVLHNIACDAVINPILKRRGYTLPAGGVEIPVQKHETSEEVYDRLEQQAKKGGQKGQMPKWGTVMDLKTGETRELTEAEHLEAQKKVIDAAQKARQAGKMPGEFEAIVESPFLGRRDWKDALRKFLGGGHERTRSWSRPNRRFQDVIMPGMSAYGPGEIAVFIDTSGSIDEELGKKFVAEVRKLTEDLTPDKVHVMCIDTRVQWERTYSGYEQIDGVQFKGRGGTDFKPGFERLQERGVTPKAVVYFTDLECSSFPKQPPYGVMWVVWPGGANKVPWGEIIRM